MEGRLELPTAATEVSLCGADLTVWPPATALSLSATWSRLITMRGIWGDVSRIEGLIHYPGAGPAVVIATPSPGVAAPSSPSAHAGNAPSDAYTQRRARALDEPVADTLNDLAMTWGMAWVDIARILGVSVPALRKWRLSTNQPTVERREQLAALAGILAALRARGVSEPAGRLNARLLDAYSVTLADVVAQGEPGPVLRYIAGELTVEALLDESLTSWRTDYAARTEMVVRPDGERVLRLRSF